MYVGLVLHNSPYKISEGRYSAQSPTMMKSFQSETEDQLTILVG